MSLNKKLMQAIMSGWQDGYIPFSELCSVLKSFGFRNLPYNGRTAADNYIFVNDDEEEIIAIQPDGHMAKPYQVKLVREYILKFRSEGDVFTQEEIEEVRNGISKETKAKPYKVRPVRVAGLKPQAGRR